MKSRVGFNYNVYFDKLDGPANLIIELRTNDPNVPGTLKSLCWTMLALFDPSGNLNSGRWRLPMYKCPTNLE